MNSVRRVRARGEMAEIRTKAEARHGVHPHALRSLRRAHPGTVPVPLREVRALQRRAGRPFGQQAVREIARLVKWQGGTSDRKRIG